MTTSDKLTPTGVLHVPRIPPAKRPRRKPSTKIWGSSWLAVEERNPLVDNPEPPKNPVAQESAQIPNAIGFLPAIIGISVFGAIVWWFRRGF